MPAKRLPNVSGLASMRKIPSVLRPWRPPATNQRTATTKPDTTSVRQLLVEPFECPLAAVPHGEADRADAGANDQADKKCGFHEAYPFAKYVPRPQTLARANVSVFKLDRDLQGLRDTRPVKENFAAVALPQRMVDSRNRSIVDQLFHRAGTDE
jgi:hypothetical protein